MIWLLFNYSSYVLEHFLLLFAYFSSFQFDPALCTDHRNSPHEFLHAIRFRRKSDTRHHHSFVNDGVSYGRFSTSF